MSQYFPKQYKSFERMINIKFDLTNYSAKTDLKNISLVDISSFALKLNLDGLKVDKLNID